MDITITDWHHLMDQAGATASHYMLEAVQEIDRLLGVDARKHPELIAAFMLTAAQDFHGSTLKLGLQDLRDAVSSVADAIRDQNL